MPTLDVLSTSGVGTYGPYMNMLTLTDVKTRQAIAMAVDAQGIIDSIYGGAGHINRGVLPGMPAADDQPFIDYDPAKAKELLDASTWDKSKPLRIVFDKSFAGVEQWTPIMQQNLEDIGFKVELMGLDTTAAIEMYDKIDQFDVTIAQGGAQGVSPFAVADLLQLQADRTSPLQDLFAQLRDRRRLRRRTQGARRRQAARDLQEPQQADRRRGREGLLVDDQRPQRQDQAPRRRRDPAEHAGVHRRGPELGPEPVATALVIKSTLRPPQST